jgi:Na+/H+ antiporter NhaD/arsenite permease-like protein
MIKILSIIIFILGYLGISQEHILKISKTSLSLILGVVLWILAIIHKSGNAGPGLLESGGEIFGLIVFLLSAMTLVEILTHYGLFDFIYKKIIGLGLKDKSQFFIICTLTFAFSSILDNLTTTIVFIQIARRFFKGENLMRATSAIIISANAGGVFSPVGDVTTTMLWLSGKFTAQQIFTTGFLPSLAVFIIAVLWIGSSVTNDTADRMEESAVLDKFDWLIITMSFLSFCLPFLMTLINLPPYFGLILGLGIIWMTIDLARLQRPESTKLSMSIDKFFQKTDISSLYFFVGILLSISALEYMGIMEEMSHALFSSNPSFMKILGGNVAIGFLSSIFDNIPLTAAAIKIVKTSDPNLWVLLALTAGTGGSLLLIGSAPGIVAMNIVKGLSFTKYARLATIPALFGYAAGILVWFIQYRILFS